MCVDTTEMENVPHQSDLHHSLFDIAAAFVEGLDWFKSVEVPLRDILGDDIADRIKAANWQEDGQDFYALIERWIENTALDQKKGNEAQFMHLVVMNCASGFVGKYNKVLNKMDIGEIVGKTFEKIIVAEKYNSMDIKAKKVSYLQTTVYSAGYELLRNRGQGQIKKEEKEVTARAKNPNNGQSQFFTIEDVLIEMDMVIGPKNNRSKAA